MSAVAIDRSHMLGDALDGVNFRKGRGNSPYGVDAIVIHVTQGTAASAIEWFHDPAAQVSAHYMVQKDGVIVQFVDENDRAYHAGQLVQPSSELVLARKPYTPNSWAIGIEHEGDGTHELTDAQRVATYALQLDIIRRRNVLCDRVHIIGHHEVKKSKDCPGAIDVDRIVRDLSVALHGAPAPAPTPTPEPEPAIAIPPIVYSPSLGWLVPITVRSDTNWTFATVVEVRRAAQAGRPVNSMEAGTRLSDMPRSGPGDT
jgi:hypothetical protein